ncbi:MAG: site-specific integrase [Nanoarchaeota archaeon]|nr:site-specific integrase [Nanoarchaeota archaeon]MBU1028479.1 site-specific integrase [Nanoarchaeota archaeon]
MKIDPYNHKERYIKWKQKAQHSGLANISSYNSDLILQYLDDMENGINIAICNVKGPRSYIRLNTLRDKLRFFSMKFKEIYDLDKITDVTEEQVITFFTNMRKGNIVRQDGKRYASTAYFVKIFKAFWHWWIKVNKKKGIEIRDISNDLDTSQDKPKWVYLTEKQVKQLCDKAKYEYKILIMFLFDSGIRSPSELINIKVSDLYGDCKELHIRDEISKTFGRRIKLMICSKLLKDYIIEKDLKKEDYLFPINPKVVNRYLKRLASKIIGENPSEAGEKFSELTMYDFRHISCCYWLPRYKSESALKYRFGWKRSDKIHYYSELLGMKDTITEEDLLVDVTKTEIEARLTKSENQNQLLSEELESVRKQMQQILRFTNKLYQIGGIN